MGERAEPADRWGSLRGRKGTRGTRVMGVWQSLRVGVGGERGLERGCGAVWGGLRAFCGVGGRLSWVDLQSPVLSL